MAENSTIEWCHHTFNPWTGCTKISPGCDRCYAESWAKRSGHVQWGDAPRRRTSWANWGLPLKWNARAAAEGRRFRVFCASLADVFDNQVPWQWRDDLLDLIDRTPYLDWLLLTKRIGNAARMLEECGADALPSNVWLGATVVNQEEADRDVPKLLATPARVRFLSMEPLLGPVDLDRLARQPNDTDRRMPGCGRVDRFFFSALHGQDGLRMQDGREWFGEPQHRRVDWVIAGGESGHGARPMHPDWARSLRDQCAAAGVPFLFKQWGEYVCDPIDPATDDAPHICAIDRDGRDWALCKPKNDGWWALKPDASTWGEIGEVPAGVVEWRRIGKKAAGRLLDGRTHDAFPEVA